MKTPEDIRMFTDRVYSGGRDEVSGGSFCVKTWILVTWAVYSVYSRSFVGVLMVDLYSLDLFSVLFFVVSVK